MITKKDAKEGDTFTFRDRTYTTHINQDAKVFKCRRCAFADHKIMCIDTHCEDFLNSDGKERYYSLVIEPIMPTVTMATKEDMQEGETFEFNENTYLVHVDTDNNAAPCEMCAMYYMNKLKVCQLMHCTEYENSDGLRRNYEKVEKLK